MIDLVKVLLDALDSWAKKEKIEDWDLKKMNLDSKYEVTTRQLHSLASECNDASAKAIGSLQKTLLKNLIRDLKEED